MTDPRCAFLEAVHEVSPELRCRAWCRRQPKCRWTQIIAVGKAAESMARGVAQVWNHLPALLVLPHPPQSVPCGVNWEVMVSSHPQLTTASLRAGARLLDWARRPGSSLVLLSGGSSALVEVLVPGLASPEAFRNWEQWYRCGLSIVEMNQLRSQFSLLKGGGLLECFQGSSHTLVWSDVLQGARWVGSGPTWREPMPPGHGFEVLGRGQDLRKAMARQLRRRGWKVRFRAAFLTGLPQAVRRLRKWRPARGEVLLACAEITVAVTGRGRGGRCQALVLEMLEWLEQQHCGLLAASSDGCDGPTAYAGAEADPGTLGRARKLGLEPGQYRGRQASSEFFEQLGEAWQTGPTGNNLNDILALWRWQAPPGAT